MVSNDSGFLEAVVGSAPNVRGSVPAPGCSGPQTGRLEGGLMDEIENDGDRPWEHANTVDRSQFKSVTVFYVVNHPLLINARKDIVNLWCFWCSLPCFLLTKTIRLWVRRQLSSVLQHEPNAKFLRTPGHCGLSFWHVTPGKAIRVMCIQYANAH